MSFNQSVSFTCTSLQGTNKVGNLTKDADGYRSMVIGGLNIYNSQGQYYPYEGAKALFEDSGPFMRRIKRGSLRGEVGHPKQLPGQTVDDYIRRVLDIDPNNTCVHFKDIWLDFNRLKDSQGRQVVAIMAKLCPSGAKGDFLEKQLENSKENVCFSVRSFSKDYKYKGEYIRNIQQIITFDYVNEPGIAIAEKWASPALEEHGSSVFTRTQLERAVQPIHSGSANESARMNASELFTAFNWEVPPELKPAFARW